MLLGQADVAHPVEDAVEADPPLGPGQGATGTGVGTPAEGHVCPGVGPVHVELRRVLEAPGIAVGGAVQQHDRCAGRNVHAADGRRTAGETEVGLHRALDAQGLFDEARDELFVRPELVLELGVLGEVLQRNGEQACGRLLTGGEQEGRGAHHGGHVGHGPVRVRRQRKVGQDVLSGLAPSVLDVLCEPFVEPRQRIEPHLPLLAGAELPGDMTQAEAFAEPLVVLFGHPEQIGDDEHGEGL